MNVRRIATVVLVLVVGMALSCCVGTGSKKLGAGASGGPGYSDRFEVSDTLRFLNTLTTGPKAHFDFKELQPSYWATGINIADDSSIRPGDWLTWDRIGDTVSAIKIQAAGGETLAIADSVSRDIGIEQSAFYIGVRCYAQAAADTTVIIGQDNALHTATLTYVHGTAGGWTWNATPLRKVSKAFKRNATVGDSTVIVAMAFRSVRKCIVTTDTFACGVAIDSGKGREYPLRFCYEGFCNAYVHASAALPLRPGAPLYTYGGSTAGYAQPVYYNALGKQVGWAVKPGSADALYRVYVRTQR